MEIIKKIPLFNDIDIDDIPSLLSCLDASVKEFKKNSVILSEGDSPEYICAVLKGNIIISHNDYNGNRSIISTIAAPNIFSEAFTCSAADSLPVSVTAAENCVILFISGRKLLDPCSNSCPSHKTLISNLITILARKNILLNQKLELLSKRTTKEKIMAYLLAESKKHDSRSFTIPYDRQALADYLGVERSAMSAEISKLKKAGLIESNKSQFKLLF